MLATTDINPEDKALQEDFMALESDDSDFERNKISPEQFAKNVLQECNFLKKPPHHTRPLQGGSSVVSKGWNNPAYMATTSHTFYGHKLSQSGLLFPPKPAAITDRFKNKRTSDLELPGHTSTRELNHLLQEQE